MCEICFHFQLICSFFFFIEKVSQSPYSFIFFPWFILFPWIVKKTQSVSPYVSLNVISLIKIVINYLLFFFIYSHFGNCRDPRERDFSYLQKNSTRRLLHFLLQRRGSSNGDVILHVQRGSSNIPVGIYVFVSSPVGCHAFVSPMLALLGARTVWSLWSVCHEIGHAMSLHHMV